MRYFLPLLAILLLVLTGCNNKKTTTVPIIPPPPPPEPATPMAPISPPAAPVPKEPIHSAEYIRGYNDGYSGAWLAPGHWFIANEYRSGHSAGAADRKNGLPHHFHK